MNFIIGKEHIENQFNNNFFANAMDITSFINDNTVFSQNKNNEDWKEQWMKYCRIIMPHSGYKIKYSNPYKSKKLKQITQYTILNKDNKEIDSNITHCLENAEAQAYIKISQIAVFEKYYQDKMKTLEPFINMIEKFRIDSNPYSRHYRANRDLNELKNNKKLNREWKLSRII